MGLFSRKSKKKKQDDYKGTSDALTLEDDLQYELYSEVLQVDDSVSEQTEQNKVIKKKPPDLSDEIRKLSADPITEHIGNRLQEILTLPAYESDDFIEIFDMIEDLLPLYIIKATQNGDNSALSSALVMIMNTDHSIHAKTYEHFAQDLTHIPADAQTLNEAFEHIEQKDDAFLQIHAGFNALLNEYTALVSECEELSVSQKKLSGEILNFTDLINLLSEKHKLSPDWNGKKQQMVKLSEELSVKRNNSLSEEARLNRKIVDFYKKQSSAYASFVELIPDLIEKPAGVDPAETAASSKLVSTLTETREKLLSYSESL